MFVRLTFVKRFSKHKFLYHKGRVYNVDERLGLELCGTMVNDMPAFSIVDPAKIGETPVVDLLMEDEQEEEVVAPKTVTKVPVAKKQVRKTSKPKGKTVTAKKAPRLKKAAPRAKAAVAPKTDNEVEV